MCVFVCVHPTCAFMLSMVRSMMCVLQPLYKNNFTHAAIMCYIIIIAVSLYQLYFFTKHDGYFFKYYFHFVFFMSVLQILLNKPHLCNDLQSSFPVSMILFQLLLALKIVKCVSYTHVYAIWSGKGK